MRSVRTRAALCAALPALASTPAAAQGLGLIEGLFDEVSAVTVFYQLGGVPASEDVTSDGPLHGAGSEVLINLKSTERTSYELGLGASYLRGYRAVEPSLDLRASLRALPTVSLYASRDSALGALTVYGGASFGLIELWNAQAYGPSGQPWNVEAQTFELGASLGVYLTHTPLAGLFAESGYRFRNFHSVTWSSTADEELPGEWPRALDFSGPFLSLGWQLQLRGEKDEKANAETPAPAAPGGWLLERVDGAPLPAFFDSTSQGRHEVVHGVLRLTPSAAHGRGAWALELDTRARGGLRGAGQPAVLLQPVRASGTYTARDGVLVLNREQTAEEAGQAELIAGRFYVRWNGHVLVFARGGAPAR